MTDQRGLRAAGEGVQLDLTVVPGASSTRFPSGFDPWRGAVQARVQAAPRDGAANRELVAAVAAFFGVDARRVRVVRGAGSRRKTVEVEGLDEARARRLLEASLA